MPRAENRKRPANMPGNFSGGGNRSQQNGFSQDASVKQAKNARQELIEKMKKLQANHKTETRESE